MTAASYRAVLFGLPIPQQSSSVVGTVAQNELAVKGSWDDGTALAWAAGMGQGSRVRHPLQATQITLTTLQTPFPFPDSIRRPGLGSPWSPARHNKLAGRWVAQATRPLLSRPCETSRRQQSQRQVPGTPAAAFVVGDEVVVVSHFLFKQSSNRPLRSPSPFSSLFCRSCCRRCHPSPPPFSFFLSLRLLGAGGQVNR